ncbi:MAG TPA: outer membrane beta-barrel protein [Burkholderiales bacterium]|jgi:hypothetical protein|nr:outer membrane beta-barrel protein [Burkholderiales bacterium]
MRLICILLMLAFPLLAHAEEKGRFYVAAGRFSPAPNDQFANPSGQYGLVLGGGGRFSPHFSWDVDLLFVDQRIDTPKAFAPPNQFFVSQSGRADLDTWGIGGIFKGILPVSTWLELYAGGGPGWYKSTLTVHRTGAFFFIPIPVDDVTRTDKGMGFQWVAGANAKLGERWALGFQWRRLDLKAQLGPEIKSEVNVGGNFGLLYSRWAF